MLKLSPEVVTEGEGSELHDLIWRWDLKREREVTWCASLGRQFLAQRVGERRETLKEMVEKGRRELTTQGI